MPKGWIPEFAATGQLDLGEALVVVLGREPKCRVLGRRPTAWAAGSMGTACARGIRRLGGVTRGTIRRKVPPSRVRERTSNVACPSPRPSYAPAMDWAASRPPGAARDRLLVGAYRSWARADSAAVSEWIGDGDLEPSLAPVVTAHAARMARRNPQGAAAWVGAIPDPELRRRSQQAIESRPRRRTP